MAGLAAFASAVPWALTTATESGGIDYLPLVSFAAVFIGSAARPLFVLDLFVTSMLPLLVPTA